MIVKESPLSRKTGPWLVLKCLKEISSRQDHLKSTFQETPGGFPPGKNSKKNSKTSFAAEPFVDASLRQIHIRKQLLAMVFAKEIEVLDLNRPISPLKTKNQGLMQR